MGEQTCGPGCAKELLRRKVRANRQTRRLAELTPVRDRLRALPAEAFLVFAERDRAIVRRYYGLAEDGIFHTQDELALQFGVHQTTVGTIVRNAAACLLPRNHVADDPGASSSPLPPELDPPSTFSGEQG